MNRVRISFHSPKSKVVFPTLKSVKSVIPSTILSVSVRVDNCHISLENCKRNDKMKVARRCEWILFNSHALELLS